MLVTRFDFLIGQNLMKPLFKNTIVLIAIVVATASCSHITGGKTRINPAHEFYERELPYIVRACDAILFENAKMDDVFLQRGYRRSKLRSNRRNSTYIINGVKFPYLSTAVIGFGESNVCHMEFSVGSVSGLSFRHFNKALSSLGYKFVRKEKYGTFNLLTRIVLSKGEHTISVSGKSRSENGSGNIWMIMTRK